MPISVQSGSAAEADSVNPTGYVTYADYVTDQGDYDNGRVVLFFNATWCPTCHEAEQTLKSSSIPEDLTVVAVDFDSSQDLRERYGVTTQHTFVQVDADGNELGKFSGSTTVDEVEASLV